MNKVKLNTGEKNADGSTTPGPFDQVWRDVTEKMDEIKQWLIDNWRMVVKYGAIGIGSIIALFNIGGVVHTVRKFGKGSNAVMKSVFCSCFMVWDFLKWCFGRCGFTWFAEPAPQQEPPRMGAQSNPVFNINVSNQPD